MREDVKKRRKELGQKCSITSKAYIEEVQSTLATIQSLPLRLDAYNIQVSLANTQAIVPLPSARPAAIWQQPQHKPRPSRSIVVETGIINISPPTDLTGSLALVNDQARMCPTPMDATFPIDVGSMQLRLVKSSVDGIRQGDSYADIQKRHIQKRHMDV